MPVKKSKSVGKKPAARPSRRRAPVAELAPAVWDEDIREDRELDTPERIEARPVMLLVVGPHRSGTSVAARALECLGAVNSPNLMAADPANPKGYFEDNDIYLFNNRVLMPALGRAWYSTCPVDWTVLSKAERSRLGLQALEIVRRNYPLGNAVSVLKEPRISTLLPFWLSVLHHAGFAVRLVGAVRDPLSVARSLKQRDGFSLTHGGMLYLTTWISILQQAGETTLAFVSFEDLLANPSKALRRAADRLQLLLPADFEARAASFAAGHVDRDLCHSIVDPNDVSLEPDLPPAVTDLFAGLREAVSSQNARKAAKAVAAAERLVQAMLPALGDFDRVFSERQQERQSARGASEQLQQQVQAYQARVHELEQSSSALQHQLQSASAPQELANLRAQAEALQVTAAEKSARLEALTAELAARDTRLQEVQVQLDTLRSENSELDTRHEDLATRHQSLVTASQQREAEYFDLATRHKSHVASHDALTTRLAALEAQNQEATARQVAADDERQHLAAERDNLAAQLESLRSENSELVTRHQSLATSHEELVARHQSLVTSQEELVTRHQSLATTHEDLVTRHTALVTSHESLRAENSELATRHQSLATTHEDLATRHKSHVASHDALTTRLAALEAQNQEATARQVAADDERQRLAAERDQLAAGLESLRSKHSALVTNLRSLESKQSSGAQEISALRNRLDRAEDQRKEAIARADEAERKEEELEAKIALLAAAREKLLAEKDDLTSRLTRAESERERLQQNVDERFEELAKLTRRLVASEDEKAQAEKLRHKISLAAARLNKIQQHNDYQAQNLKELLIQRTDLEAELIQSREEGASRAAEVGTLSKKLSVAEANAIALHEQNADLRANIQARFREIGLLSQHVLELETNLRGVNRSLHSLLRSHSWRLTSMFRKFKGGSELDSIASDYAMHYKSEYKLIKESGLFDAKYYLDHNADVALRGIDPLEHFIIYGADEGRNPSKSFQMRDYLRKHPELAVNTSINPLVHYISRDKT